MKHTKDTPLVHKNTRNAFGELPKELQDDMLKAVVAIRKQDTPKETWEKRFLKEFVNTHNETWRPLRGLWVEDVLAFIAKELELAKAAGAREVIEAVFQQIATMDGIKCEQERDIFRLLATLREDYKEEV